jgi:hypothetical protein
MIQRIPAIALTALLAAASTVAVAQGAPGGPPPGGMPGGPRGPGGPGGPPGGMPGGPPSKAAIYIDNGTQVGAKEYQPGQYQGNVTSGAQGVTIDGASISSGEYGFTGVAVTGEKSVVTLNNVKMKLGVTKEAGAKDKSGAALSVSNGATVRLNRSMLVVDGAQRYTTETGGSSKLIVNDSTVTQTGSNAFTSKMTEPFSNDALYISGIARANMSVGTSKTYYFNSTVTTEGWAALSTDAGMKPGLNLVAYNTNAIAQHGGYGTYADFDCSVWLYGSRLESPEVGAIIAKSGHITVADGGSAPADVLQYNTGKQTAAGSVVTGGRNAVMMHAPDMMGEGIAAADAGTLDVIRSTLATDRRLVSSRDYGKHIGPAAAAYIHYINGADLLIKSTSGNFNFDGATLKSFSNVLVMTVLNSDRMGNFLKAESDGAAVKPVAVSFRNMSATGDVRHMDYQRIMTLSLENATLKGSVVSGSLGDWNKLWATFERKDMKWVVDEQWNTFYGVRLTLKRGSTWEVTGASLLSSLRLENGATLKGRVQVDGKAVTPVAGQTYAGRIALTPL